MENFVTKLPNCAEVFSTDGFGNFSASAVFVDRLTTEKLGPRRYSEALSAAIRSNDRSFLMVNGAGGDGKTWLTSYTAHTWPKPGERGDQSFLFYNCSRAADNPISVAAALHNELLSPKRDSARLRKIVISEELARDSRIGGKVTLANVDIDVAWSRAQKQNVQTEFDASESAITLEELLARIPHQSQVLVVDEFDDLHLPQQVELLDHLVHLTGNGVKVVLVCNETPTTAQWGSRRLDKCVELFVPPWELRDLANIASNGFKSADRAVPSEPALRLLALMVVRRPLYMQDTCRLLCTRSVAGQPLDAEDVIQAAQDACNGIPGGRAAKTFFRELAVTDVWVHVLAPMFAKFVNGGFPIGTFTPAARIAEELEVSRSVLHHALGVLAEALSNSKVPDHVRTSIRLLDDPAGVTISSSPLLFAFAVDFSSML